MRILMVSGEYPPMKGGIGRYTDNLVHAIRKKKNIDIHVAIASHKEITTSTTSTVSMCTASTSSSNSDNNNNDNTNNVYHGIIKKGDRKNSDRLLHLVRKLKPDIVNIQYERGLYESDVTISHMIRRVLYGSTLHKFYEQCPVPTISTLHTVFPYDEYQPYIKERALRKEGRLGFLPLPIRAPIRRWAMERRYNLLHEVVRLSNEIISPARTIYEVVKRGTIIYHGAEPPPSLSSGNKQEFRKEFGLPDDKRLLLAFGYVGSYKGFDILDDLKLPDGWSTVVKQNKHERGREKPIHIKNAINLHLGYIDDITLSKLFFACDAIIFPYRVVSISGVLFDALAHGLPFVASDLKFFREFAEMGLGITCHRNRISFSESIANFAAEYDRYRNNVLKFNPELRWSNVADKHVDLYSKLLRIQ